MPMRRTAGQRPNLLHLLIRQVLLMITLLATLATYALNEKTTIADHSDTQLDLLQQELIETQLKVNAYLNWAQLASSIELNANRFQLEFELLTMDPDRDQQLMAELTEKLGNNEAELSALPATDPLHAMTSTLKQHVWVLADIGFELLETEGSNARLQLFRDSLSIVTEIKFSITEISRDIFNQTDDLKRHIDSIVSQSHSGQSQQQSLFDQLTTVMIFTAGLSIAAILLLLHNLFTHLHQRIVLLEQYAQDIGDQRYTRPPFSSKDITGKLAVHMGLMARKIRQSLRQVEDSQQEIQTLAYYDTLTGLENRRLFYSNLEQSLSSVKRYREHVALILLDLDRFKHINDSLGHEAGDLLLEAVSQRLRKTLRLDDHLARLGGDEFAILARHTRASGAVLAQRILAALAEPVMLNAHEVRISVSIGIVIIGEDSDNVSDLMRQVDLALYQAKEKGRGNYQFFSRQLQNDADQKMHLIAEIRAAMHLDQFELYYQPKYRIQDGSMIGAEALIRWQHPDKGFISPADFIPAAEECGLIIPLGEWILTQAYRDAQRLAKLDASLSIAINLSAKQFEDPDLLQKILAIRGSQNQAAPKIELEVTESLLLKDIHSSIRLLGELQAAGFQIAIDDFGTGFSSMSYLKNLPVDTLKIDRCFIIELPENDKDAAIVESVINLAHRLGLEVVAEGIETEQQLEYLKACQCDIAQGYLLGKPQPLNLLLSRLEAENVST